MVRVEQAVPPLVGPPREPVFSLKFHPLIPSFLFQISKWGILNFAEPFTKTIKFLIPTSKKKNEPCLSFLIQLLQVYVHMTWM